MCRKDEQYEPETFVSSQISSYHKGLDGIWRREIRKFEKQAILLEAHQGIVGGHYAGSPRQEKYGKAGYGGLQRKKMPMTVLC